MIQKRGLSIFDAFLLAVVIVGILVSGSPLTALAAEPASLQTAQVIPPGFNTCVAPQVQDFTTYTYDGSLQAFEFTLTDTSYVAVIGSVGESSIPFTQMTRSVTDSTNLRIHADVSIPVPTSLPITVTLLSAQQGSPVCLTIVSSSAQGAPGVVSTQVLPPTTQPSYSGSNPSDYNTPTPSPSASNSIPSTSNGSVIGGSLQNVLKNACSDTSPSRIWVILLAVYAVIAAAATLWEPKKLPAYWTEWVAAAIIIPLILLFGFWYLAENCRAGAWVPVTTIVIALSGLYAAFNKHPHAAGVIQLPAGQKDPTKQI